MKLSWKALVGVGVTVSGSGYAQIAPPTKHFAPDRDYHMIRAVTSYDIDETHQRASATVTLTFSMLRQGISNVRFDTSAEKVLSIEVDGKPINGTNLGQVPIVGGPTGTVHTLKTKSEGTFFHWFKPSKDEPERSGFYTEGLSGSPVGWAYPNDRYATELHMTLPKAWSMYSNGLLMSDAPVGTNRHTVVWKMDEPHPNYLNSIVVGPFVEHKDTWHGMPLILTCPPSIADKLDYTFSPTKDILDYFSDVTGVKYPWCKYGQNLTYDHNYAEENVTATMYPVYWAEQPFLTDPRDGHRSEWVIAHETAHHWFGDYVTCKNWGDTWINEGFASFMEMMYALHSRGKFESLRQMEQYNQRYFQDAKHDFRPIATDTYSDSIGMGGWTTYNKGAGVLMTLRYQLGDNAFWRGIKLYMQRRGKGNAESNDFCEDMTDATGINLHAWMEQWVYKPGHPVIDWSWAYDETSKSVKLHVKQVQDTSRGIPIYNVPTHIGLVTSSGLSRAYVTLNGADQTLSIPVSEKPKTVLFDSDHEFVREIVSEPWTQDELLPVFLYAPDPINQDYALSKLLDGNLSSETLNQIVTRLRQDRTEFCAVRNTTKLAELKLPELHAFWLEEAKHPNFERRACAATGLARIANGASDVAVLHKMLGDDQPYISVASAIRGLATIDFPSIKDFVFKMAKSAKNQDVRTAALDVLAQSKPNGWEYPILETASEGHTTFIRRIGVRALAHLEAEDPRLANSLRSAFHAGEEQVVSAAISVAGSHKVKAVLPDLQALKAAGAHVGEVDSAIREIGG